MDTPIRTATLTFVLDQPEGEDALHMALQGQRWQHVVCDLDEELRRDAKYNEQDAEAERAAHWRTRLRDLLAESGLSIP